KKEYQDALKQLENDPTEAIDNLHKLFNKIGINISKKALQPTNFVYTDERVMNPVTQRMTNLRMSVSDLLKNKTKYIFDRLAGDARNKNSENSLDGNNPFIDDLTQLEYLFKLENNVNPTLFEASFISGDGKAKYSFVNNTYLSHKIKEVLDDDFYLEELRSTGYASN